MFLEIELESEQPIYVQIYNQIVKGISRGDLQSGEELPSVRQLSSDIGVDKNTVVKAYNLLKQQGIINVHRRKGVVIADEDKRIMSPELVEKLRDDLEILVASGLCFHLSKEDLREMFAEILENY